MSTRKIVIRAVLALIGLPIVLGLLAFGFFYSVFYFPNWTSATSGTIVSSGEKRQYLLYVPKSYDRTKPAPLVITLHTSMSWDSSSMVISQWNSVADENGFIVVYRQSLAVAHFRVFRALWRIGLGETSADRIPSNLRSLRM
jgi:poly(3-hydroxybutyrate) depolymerase